MYTRLTALFPGLRGSADTRKVKPTWILLKQETVSGSGISWAICKSAPRSRCQHPTTHFFYRPDALPAAQPTASTHWRQYSNTVWWQHYSMTALMLLYCYLVRNQMFSCHLECCHRLQYFHLKTVTRAASIKNFQCFVGWLKLTALSTWTTHPFNGPLSGTTRVGRYQKGKTNLDFTEARDSEWQWHQLDICKSAPCSRQITMPALHHSVFYRPGALPAAQPTVSKHWRQTWTTCLKIATSLETARVDTSPVFDQTIVFFWYKVRLQFHSKTRIGECPVF